MCWEYKLLLVMFKTHLSHNKRVFCKILLVIYFVPILTAQHKAVSRKENVLP